MSWASTIARILSCVSGTPGVDNVYEAPLAGESPVRSAQEVARNVEVGQVIQSWELQAEAAPRVEGVDGYQETGGKFTLTAHYAHRAGSLVVFRDLVRQVGERLLDPTTGLPQIRDGVVEPVEMSDTPVKLPSGQSAWRAVVRFATWDVSST